MDSFRHGSMIHDTESMSELMDKFGVTGYGVWWLILEKIAKEASNSKECGCSATVVQWARFCRVSKNKFIAIALMLDDLDKLSFQQIGKEVYIESPTIKSLYLSDQSLRSLPEYKKWRDAVLKKHLYTCQDCGVYRAKLHVHHIKPYAEFPALRIDIENGLTLCVDCHKKRHRAF